MTDLEMTRLCAESMGFNDVHIAYGSMGTAYVKYGGRSVTQGTEFRPLHDDAQAMALVKRFRLRINSVYVESDRWLVSSQWRDGNSTDLNRAIVECIAKMQAKVTP